MMNTVMEASLLVVEDERALRGMLVEILQGAGFARVWAAADCSEARQLFAMHAPDCVVLDVMLPDGDGFSLMRELRWTRDVPILFLSARDADADRLRGLGLGADDYITKPFLPRELVLRLTAVLRRAYRIRETDTLRLGEVIVDWGSGEVRRPDGEMISLTAKEFALLRKLAACRGNIVTIDALCRAAWGEESFGCENTLMVHIRRLRAKVEQNPSQPQWIKTVRGLGYKLEREGKP